MGRCVCCLRTWAALISKRSRALTYICIYFSLQSGWCVNERRSVGSGPWFQRHTLPPAKSFFFFLSGLFKRFQENQIEKGENDSSPTKKDDGGQFSVSETPKVVSFLCGSWRPKVWQAPHFIVSGEAASSLEIIAPFSRLRSAVWWLRSNCWHRSWWLMHCDNWLPTFCCFGQTAVAGEGQRQLRTNCVRACVCVYAVHRVGWCEPAVGYCFSHQLSNCCRQQACVFVAKGSLSFLFVSWTSTVSNLAQCTILSR